MNFGAIVLNSAEILFGSLETSGLHFCDIDLKVQLMSLFRQDCSFAVRKVMYILVRKNIELVRDNES